MKTLSKTTWILIIAGVAIIALAGVAKAYAQQPAQQGSTTASTSPADKLRLNNMQVTQMAIKKKELQQLFADNTTALETIKAKLSQPIESINIIGGLIESAANCRVEIAEIVTSDVTTENILGVKCSSRSVTANIKGDIPGLVGFIGVLNKKLPTAVVKIVNIDIPDNANEKASGSIKLSVYSYKGD